MLSRVMNALSRKRSALNENEKGFTLIELLVVVIIIGILAAIAIPVFLGQQDSAKDAGVKSDLANAKIAVVSYYTDNTSGTPTFDSTATTGLKNYGFTASDNTNTMSFAGTAPTGPGQAFCITAKSKSSGTPDFSISSTGGVKKSADCS